MKLKVVNTHHKLSSNPVAAPLYLIVYCFNSLLRLCCWEVRLHEISVQGASALDMVGCAFDLGKLPFFILHWPYTCTCTGDRDSALCSCRQIVVVFAY